MKNPLIAFPRPPMNEDGKVSRLIIDLLFAVCVITLASCAWTKTHQKQIGAVSEVALQHIAKDAYAIGLAAFSDEIASGFSGDLGYALQQNARQQLPSILSSENLTDYLKAWGKAHEGDSQPGCPSSLIKTSDALSSLVPKGLDPASAQKVALILVDSQAAAISAAQPITLSEK